MTPREAAEKRELELLVDFIATRNFQNAGDLAEMKAAFEEAAKELNEAKPEPPDIDA